MDWHRSTIAFTLSVVANGTIGEFAAAQTTPTVPAAPAGQLFRDVEIRECTRSEINRYVETLDYQPNYLLPYRTSFWSLVYCDQPAVSALTAALASPDRNIRSGASMVLGKIGTNAIEAIPALVTALRDENSDVQMNAAIALGQIVQATGIQPETQAVTTALVANLGDEDESVRSTAAEALGQIGATAYQAFEAVPQQHSDSEDSLVKLLEAIGGALFDVLSVSYVENRYSTDTLSAVDALEQIRPGLVWDVIDYPGGSQGGGVTSTPGGSQLAYRVRDHLDANRPAICRLEAMRHILPRCRTRR